MIYFCALQEKSYALDSNQKGLTIATEGYLRPYNLTRPDGTLDGYEIELGKYLCQHMKVECTFVSQPFDGVIPGLTVGKFDAIMGALTATKAREKIIDFSISYSLTPQVFAALQGSKYNNLPHTGETLHLSQDPAITSKTVNDVGTAIEGATVGVVVGSIAQSLVNEYFGNKITTREYKFSDEADLDLRTGRIDMLVNSQAYVLTNKDMPGYENTVITGPFYKGGILGRGVAVGLRKDEPELRKRFNEAIRAAKADGTIKRLSEKWFGFDVTP
ncbi:ABC transporter substrate-binding protein [Ochrobactrum vermis]|nr:ABC transporter substrate-binding protein [Ochrobactrum vermis]